MSTLDEIRKASLKRRRIQIFFSLPFIILPLILALISILKPSTFYNLLHEKKLSENNQPIILGLNFKGGIEVIYNDKSGRDNEKTILLLEESKKILADRLVRFGNFEPTIKIVKDVKQIILELPGISNYEEISKLVGETGNLEIYAIKGKISGNYDVIGKALPDSLLEELIMTKSDLVKVSIMQSPPIYVQLELKKESKKTICEKLSKYSGCTLAVMISGIVYDIFIDDFSASKSSYQDIPQAEKKESISDNIVISGNTEEGLSLIEAKKIKMILDWDVIPINLKISQITKIGPILSDDQFYLGLSAIILGIILIFFLLFISYGTYLGCIPTVVYLLSKI